jgi:hypothetical protein
MAAIYVNGPTTALPDLDKFILQSRYNRALLLC